MRRGQWRVHAVACSSVKAGAAGMHLKVAADAALPRASGAGPAEIQKGTAAQRQGAGCGQRAGRWENAVALHASQADGRTMCCARPPRVAAGRGERRSSAGVSCVAQRPHSERMRAVPTAMRATRSAEEEEKRGRESGGRRGRGRGEKRSAAVSRVRFPPRTRLFWPRVRHRRRCSRQRRARGKGRGREWEAEGESGRQREREGEEEP